VISSGIREAQSNRKDTTVIDIHEARELPGLTVKSPDGDKIGNVEQVYLDDATERPEWLLVNTGLFGTRSTFVPLQGADRDNGSVVVRHSKDQVKDAPSIEPDGHLSPAEEQELYRYYGLDAGSQDTDAPTVGRDVSGPETDDAMTRSEEELTVGTAEREAGKARLRKYVVTEHVQTTVPVQREEVRVEREPVTAANVDAATDGPAISEEEHEVTLHAEEPVVQKDVVAKERVRLSKDAVTEQRHVDEDVRREEIELDGPEPTA
jgi:uncharacterized protein (TIGR02271 family)